MDELAVLHDELPQDLLVQEVLVLQVKNNRRALLFADLVLSRRTNEVPAALALPDVRLRRPRLPRIPVT